VESFENMQFNQKRSTLKVAEKDSVKEIRTIKKKSSTLHQNYKKDAQISGIGWTPSIAELSVQRF
jgi:hypothetical protein